MRHFKLLVLASLITTLIAVDLGCEKVWKLISSGGRHSLGIADDGSLYFRGYLHHSSKPRVIAKEVKPGTKWDFAVAGNKNSFGIMADGTLWGWGSNKYGQLGEETPEMIENPVQIGSDHDWKSVAPGEEHVIGLKRDGSLYVWGTGKNGQLSDEVGEKTLTPKRIQAGKKWKAISARGFQSFAIQENGTLYAWGFNGRGALGIGQQDTDINAPTQVGNESTVWKNISAGRNHTLGITEDGRLFAWGYGESGTIGDGVHGEHVVYEPIQIGNSTWISISAGEFHSAGIQVDGSLWHWGIVTPLLIWEVNPVRIGAEYKLQQVTAYEFHTLVLTKEGYLLAWGISHLFQQTGNFMSLAVCPIKTAGFCHQNQCIERCPSGYYPKGGNGGFCTKCKKGTLLYRENLTCAEQCDPNCKTCGYFTDNCTSCVEGKFVESPLNSCRDCFSQCLTCEVLFSNCTSCRRFYSLKEGWCNHGSDLWTIGLGVISVVLYITLQVCRKIHRGGKTDAKVPMNNELGTQFTHIAN